MKIGIIGATGFIGNTLIMKLIENENNYISTFSRKKISKNSKVKSYIGNITYEDKNLVNFLNEIDVLIHLVDSFTENIDYLFNNQLKLNKILFNLVKETKISKVIYFSSIAVYGEGYKKKETDLLLPVTNYGLTKVLSESIFNLLKGYKKHIIIFRPANVYGKYSKKGVIYNFINNIESKKDIIIFGNGKQEREFLHIDDCINAICKSLKYNKSNIFNISSGKTYSLISILEMLKNNFKLDFKVKHLPIDDNNPIQVLSEDISYIKNELEWSPKVDILDGLSKILGKKYM